MLSVAEDRDLDVVPMSRSAMSAGGPDLEPADTELAATVAVLFALED